MTTQQNGSFLWGVTDWLSTPVFWEAGTYLGLYFKRRLYCFVLDRVSLRSLGCLYVNQAGPELTEICLSLSAGIGYAIMPSLKGKGRQLLLEHKLLLVRHMVKVTR